MTARGVRLVSGLVLFAYVTTHLLNHAVGLISLDALETARMWFLAFWRNPVVTTVFLSALTAHVALALFAIYRRRRFRMSVGEAAQLLLGLATPVLLLEHVLGTRGALMVAGTDDTYAYVLLALWVDAPMQALKQAFATAIVWGHGCIGLYYWLRLKPWFSACMPWLYALALLLPVLGLVGFVSAGREVARLVADDPGLRIDVALATNAPNAEQIARLQSLEMWILAGFASLLAMALLARMVRLALERRRGLVRITYPGGRVVAVPPGTSILDASLAGNIPHASVCGGRGRCSTCRVRLSGPREALPPASESEQRVLRRIGAPPDVRLACQTRPLADIAATPLLPPNASPRDGFARSAATQGQEQEIAVLFADIRGFTTLSERKLPYDVVFLLNRYFRSMGEAIEKAGGRVDKFVGDGIMALFGIDQTPQAAAAAAVQAAHAMANSLHELNELLSDDLPAPLRIGIGIHAGPAIVGEMGYGPAVSLTAIGDTVNTASRLEGETKTFGVQLVISRRALELAGTSVDGLRTEQISLRGREEALSVFVIDDASRLEARPPGR